MIIFGHKNDTHDQQLQAVESKQQCIDKGSQFTAARLMTQDGFYISYFALLIK